MSDAINAVLLNDTRGDRHHGCTLVARTIDELSAANGIRFVARSAVHQDWRADEPVLQAMASADLIVVNGEGTIHHDRPAGLRLLEAGTFAAARGIPSAMINMTWQSNGPQAVAALRAFNLVAVRESASAAEVTAAGLACLTVPDLALFRDWPAARQRSGVAVTDSVVTEATIELERLRRRVGGVPLNILYGRRGITDTIRALRRHGVGGELSLARTLAGVRAVFAERTTQTVDTAEFMRLLAGCSLLITGRFHAAILALATRTPLLAVTSNTHKIEATLRDAGLGSFRMVRPQDIDDGLIRRAGLWSADEDRALERFLSEGRRRIADLFVRLRTLVP